MIQSTEGKSKPLAAMFVVNKVANFFSVYVKNIAMRFCYLFFRFVLFNYFIDEPVKDFN